MRNAFSVVCYARSKLPLTSSVVPVVSFEYILIQEEAPDKAAIEAFVWLHTLNCVLLLSEVTPVTIPDEMLP